MRAGFIQLLVITSLSTTLSACVSQWDMQGNDPKDYYAAHPIKNKVEPRTITQPASFDGRDEALTTDEIERLRFGLHNVSPESAQAITVYMNKIDYGNLTRRENLTKSVRNLGFDKKLVTFAPDASLARNQILLTIRYAIVVSPRCPDWRTSPVTSYSNTSKGNFGCATEVNLGQQVADPSDLIRGTGEHNNADSEYTDTVLRSYHNGSKDYRPSSGSGGSTPSNPGSAVSSAVSGGAGQ